MNEKFFDLPREKQDRMINGALEVFAKNGYKHASTDDMVKAVGVSKGLWFHYFGSKAGLYIFTYDYSVKYLLLEISTVIDEGEKNFFELTKQMELAKNRVIRTYPYLLWFLETAEGENAAEVAAQTEQARQNLIGKFGELIKNTEIKGVADRARRDKIKRLTTLTINGIIKERTVSGTEPEAVYREIKAYIELIREMAERTGTEETPIS